VHAHLDDLRAEVADLDAGARERLLAALASDWRQAPLSQVDRALCAFAERLTHEPRRMSEADVLALRQQGLDDIAVHDAAQVVAYFNYINRVADALERQAMLPPLLTAAGLDPGCLRWHFIGHLQRNKAGKAAGRFHLLHGVDSEDLAQRLARRAAGDGRVERVLLEVNISGERQKNGLAPEALPGQLERLADLPGLRVDGLMGMARWGAQDVEIAASFARLRRLAETGRRDTGLPLPELSMGMSGDFELAIAEGATIVRVGGAIFGPRD